MKKIFIVFCVLSLCVSCVFAQTLNVAEQGQAAAQTETLRDIQPPDKVLNVKGSAEPEKQSVVLTWDAAADSDLQGYAIFRKEGTAPAVKINKELITETQYIDNTVARGQNYTYYVSAVDISGNESAPSRETGAPALTVISRDQIVTHEWDDGDQAVPGATITYTIEFANDGFSNAHNLVFQDAIPENTTYEYHSSDCSLPAQIYYWNTSLKGGQGDWTTQETKNTALIKKIKWVLTEPLVPVKKLGDASGKISYAVKINYL